MRSFGPLSILTAGFDERATELEEYSRRQVAISQERLQPVEKAAVGGKKEA